MDILNNIVLILQRYWDLFLEGIGVTLLLSAIAVGCGVIIGSLLALMRLSKWHIGKVRPLNLIATIYVEIIRGTPLLLQLYFFFFLLPMMIPALETSASFSITLALCLNSGAYVAEVIRAGISAVDKGQTEAARSLGLSAGRTTVKIVLPQAFKIAIPPMVNQFIITLKDTSILTIIGLAEIVNKATQYVSVRYDYFATYVWVGIFYLVFTSLLMILAHYMEKRLSYDRKGSRS